MRLTGKVKKKWGSEFIWVSNDFYCSKMLNFNTGSKCSMHFHAVKEETWYVLNGKFKVIYIDTTDATQHEQYLIQGDVWHNSALSPHQLICIETGTILETSTPDSVEDNYRVLPGDNQ